MSYRTEPVSKCAGCHDETNELEEAQDGRMYCLDGCFDHVEAAIEASIDDYEDYRACSPNWR